MSLYPIDYGRDTRPGRVKRLISRHVVISSIGDTQVPIEQSSKGARSRLSDEAPTAAAGPVVAQLTRPTSRRSVRLAIVADAHLSSEATGTWKQYQRTTRRLETAIDDAQDRDVDAVFFAGDQTKDGTSAEFRHFDELAERLDVPWVAIPGNHDVPKEFDDHSSPSIEEFREAYTPGDFPFLFSVGDVDLVGLNSAATADGELTDTWAGKVSADQIEWLRDRLPALEAPIVVLHHNLAPLPEHVDANPWNRFPVGNPEPLLDVLEEADVSLVFSGHQHLPATTAPRDVREIIAPATCSFPQGYLLVDVTPDGTVVRFVPLAGREDTLAAYWNSRTGKALAQGITDMALTRLGSFPLVDELSIDDGPDQPGETGDER